jgi:magnesium-transporting ATPase (P-type)
MGSGTDIAKEAASIVITDDNFTSIKAGIEEGRYAYDNIRKVTYLVLSTSFAEIVLFTLAIIKGLPLPLLPIQLLWLNLVTNGIRDIGLAFESGEKNTMNRPPRDPSEDIINRKMIEQTVISGLVISLLSFFMWDWLLTNNWDLNSSRNVILLFMVLILNFHVLNCRSETKSTFKISLKKNFYLLGSVIVAQFLHTISMFIPLTQDLLRMTPVSWNIWGILTLMSISIVIVMEIYKYLSKKNETNL